MDAVSSPMVVIRATRAKFRPRYLKGLFGAPLFGHLVQKRLVCVLEFSGAFFNPYFEFVAGSAKGIFCFSSP